MPERSASGARRIFPGESDVMVHGLTTLRWAGPISDGDNGEY